MRKLIVPIAALALVAVVVAFRPAPDATINASALNGAWETVEVHAELQDTTWTREEERPNMVIYSDGHWASVRISGDGWREDLPEDATDEQLLEAWRPLRAAAGSYTVSGSTITSTTTISKSPNAMNAKRANTSEFKLDGDKLVRVFTNDENGNTWTVTSKRIK
ncbi:MAG: lipocalin-like domain-containing protein [Gemmatimonadetes bacterium]|nr:lipocalin-like domain-containing protein [Gemmatimonadota bacterium]